MMRPDEFVAKEVLRRNHVDKFGRSHCIPFLSRDTPVLGLIVWSESEAGTTKDECN